MREFIYLIVGIVAFVVFVAIANVVGKFVYKKRKERKKAAQKKLFASVLEYLNIPAKNYEMLFDDYNASVIVKSRQSLDKYDYSSYFKENRYTFPIIEKNILIKKKYLDLFEKFLKDNPFKEEREYAYVEKWLKEFLRRGPKYVIRVKYISSAGNYLASKDLSLTYEKIKQIENMPELYMTKAEIKEIEKTKVEDRKKATYAKVNKIIDEANALKESLIVAKEGEVLDDLIAKLFDRTVNSIQKVKNIDSNEWELICNVIASIEKEINAIATKNKRLNDYYSSKSFADLKNTCELLMQSQKDFNTYIEEKVESISKMFGTRAVRNETEQEDVYNYVRAYKKTVSPFTAELSSAVFGSAENNPMQYLLKCFYPNKSLYKEQIINLKNLLNELETLKDAKQIIENYKKDYQQYLGNVPKYVLEEDEDGFYSRLGFAIIDENVLHVEYKFVYTSNGGMAQRSFTIPMTEETIAELVIALQDKLSIASLAKEQRALMTCKLREFIKERDNYTCCLCGNSIYKEPNLLLEIDHKIPIAKGGLTIEENLQTLCWKCNRSKGAKV